MTIRLNVCISTIDSKRNHNQYRYDVTDTQIKRCLNEIMDSYGLKKVKANKVLKEQYNIKSDGYPNIIIEDIN